MAETDFIPGRSVVGGALEWERFNGVPAEGEKVNLVRCWKGRLRRQWVARATMEGAVGLSLAVPNFMLIDVHPFPQYNFGISFSIISCISDSLSVSLEFLQLCL
jgi:hypothetical protein